MTRVSGRWVLQTPCCGARYCSRAYASINFSAHEFWSDGRRVKSLAPQGEGLCRCGCGAFFLLRQCESVGELPLVRQPAPEGWESMTAPGREPGDDSRAWFRRNHDIRPAAERALDPPDVRAVDTDDLADLLAANPPDRDVMVAARRLHWRNLNDPYREVYRAHPTPDDTALPEYRPTPGQRENMLALVALLDGAPDADYGEVAELYRELGDFARAADAVAKAVPNRWGETIAPLLRSLIAQRVNAPVRYRMW